MTENRLDRRVQRTRNLLRDALVDLVNEKGYDAVTIQDITDRANVGRTTFYLHYESKDDLLLDHHADFAGSMNLQILSAEQLLSVEAPPEQVEFLEHLSEGRAMYFAITSAKGSEQILASVQAQMAENLQASLQAAFPNQKPDVPLDALANYIVGGQLSLFHWWMSNRIGHDATAIATLVQRVQSAAIRDTYGLT